jgi:hypothetical protein
MNESLFGVQLLFLIIYFSLIICICGFEQFTEWNLTIQKDRNVTTFSASINLLLGKLKR